MQSSFVVQSSRSKKKYSKPRNLNKPRPDRDSSPVKVDIEKLLQQIKNCENELETSDFLFQAIESLEEILNQKQIKEIICLGIGRISDCSIAKYQLALISIIGKRLKCQVIKFFDPVLSASEQEAIKQLGYEVLTENIEGKYIAEDPTLFYLPHCPKQITNNLLFANWNSDQIQNLHLICNSFKSIIEATPERLLRPNAHYIIEIKDFVEEKEIENTFRFTDIFNDFSIHSFPSTKLEALSSTFWEIHPEPNYSEEDLELVKNGSIENTSRNSS